MNDGVAIFIAVFAFVVMIFLINYIWFGGYWRSVAKYLDDERNRNKENIDKKI